MKCCYVGHVAIAYHRFILCNSGSKFLPVSLSFLEVHPFLSNCYLCSLGCSFGFHHFGHLDAVGLEVWCKRLEDAVDVGHG